MIKNIYLILLGSAFIAFDVNSVEIRSFEDAKQFTLRIVTVSDTKAAGEEIKDVIESITKDKDLNKNLRVGIVEKLKLDLADSFPFVTLLAAQSVEKIKGENLYEMGNEKKLGEALYRSQKKEDNFCLDIMLEAARLSRKYAPKTYNTKIIPLMNRRGLESYL